MLGDHGKLSITPKLTLNTCKMFKLDFKWHVDVFWLAFFCCFGRIDRNALYNVGAPYIFLGELKFGLWKKKAKNSFAHQCPPARPFGIKLSWKNTSFITKRWVRTRTYSEVIQCSILLVISLKKPKISLQKIEKFVIKHKIFFKMVVTMLISGL